MIGNGSDEETDSDGDATQEGCDATRTIHRPSIPPDQFIRATVTLRAVRGRVSLRETVPGEITSLNGTPEPVAVERTNGGVTVVWECDAEQSETNLDYTVELSEQPGDGDVLSFEGVVGAENCQQSVNRNDTSTVVADVFQRVLERGEVTDADIQIAIERDDITANEVDRLRRVWVEREQIN